MSTDTNGRSWVQSIEGNGHTEEVPERWSIGEVYDERGVVRYKQLAIKVLKHFEGNLWFNHKQQEWYLYRDGCWHAGGLEHLRHFLAKYLDEKWKKDAVAQTIQLLEDYNDPDHSQRTLETDMYLVNVKNGVLDARTRALLPHDPKYLFTHQLPVDWSEMPDPVALEKVLSVHKTILGEDQVDTWFEFCGHCLVRTYYKKGFVVLYGVPNTGKSVPLMLLRAVLGAENTSSVSLEMFSKQPFTQEHTVKALANICEDDPGQHEVDASVKTWTDGSSQVTINPKHRQPYTVKPTAKFVFARNSAPRISGNDPGFWERVIPLECEHVFPSDDAGTVPRIAEQLAESSENLQALLYLYMKGLDRLIANRCYTRSDRSAQLQNSWESDNSGGVMPFWQQKMEAGGITGDGADRIRRIDVYNEFTVWYAQNVSTKRAALSRMQFGTRTTGLIKRGLLKGVMTDPNDIQGHFYYGVKATMWTGALRERE